MPADKDLIAEVARKLAELHQQGKPVTDENTSICSKVTNRNGNTVSASLIARVGSWHPGKPEDRWVIEEARVLGTHCVGCRRKLTAGEPVWLIRKCVGLGHCCENLLYWPLPHCLDCTRKLDAYLVASARLSSCLGCGRPMAMRCQARYGSTWTCCLKCRQRVLNARRPKARARAEDSHKDCIVCGGPFVGRAGALTCTSACRQKAYRDRRRHDHPTGK